MKMLDFNSLEAPEFPIVMRDDAKTVIRLTTPNEGLVERLMIASGEIKEVMEKGDAQSIAAAFDLAADLINCNLDGITVAGEELREEGKYRLGYRGLMVFLVQYLAFVKELESAKN